MGFYGFEYRNGFIDIFDFIEVNLDLKDIDLNVNLGN